MEDVEDQIRIFPVTGTYGKGDWQCIGYYKNQHIASFGLSPADALEKAMAGYNEEIERLKTYD